MQLSYTFPPRKLEIFPTNVVNCIFYPTFHVTLNQMDLIGILRSEISEKSQFQSAISQMAHMAGRSVPPFRPSLEPVRVPHEGMEQSGPKQSKDKWGELKQENHNSGE